LPFKILFYPLPEMSRENGKNALRMKLKKEENSEEEKE
jgi:hypothetical protein